MWSQGSAQQYIPGGILIINGRGKVTKRSCDIVSTRKKKTRKT
jgi:hypothetical protein